MEGDSTPFQQSDMSDGFQSSVDEIWEALFAPHPDGRNDHSDEGCVDKPNGLRRVIQNNYK